MNNVLEKYITAISALISGKTSPQDFEVWYLDNWKSESEEKITEPMYNPLNYLFCEVDAYCSIEEIRSEDDLDEAGLIEAAKNTLELLRKIQG